MIPNRNQVAGAAVAVDDACLQFFISTSASASLADLYWAQISYIKSK
jgi:hypothetical protein